MALSLSVAMAPRGGGVAAAVRKACWPRRTMHDADADDAAIVPGEDPLAVPYAHPPHADTSIIRARDQPVPVACKSEDKAAMAG